MAPSRSLIRGAVTGGAVLLIAGAVTAFAWVARSAPVAEATGPGQEPLVVATATAIWDDGYAIERTFVGRIEARQSSELGFELGGLVREVLVDEGQAVSAGAIVAVLDDQRLRARRAELKAARDEAAARQELAELDLKRITEAFEQRASSRRELDDAEQTRRATTAALDRADAALASIDVDIAKTELRSPFDAVVSERFVDAGRVVGAGVPVLGLLERQRPQARIGVAGASVDAVEVGTSVSLSVGDRIVSGLVTAISPTRERAGRAVDVIVELDTELNGLREGDLARFAVPRSIETAGFWVPMQALTEGTRGLWSLYTLESTGADGAATHLRQADVEVLHVEADRAYVRGAIPEGLRFVARGLHRVAPGMPVRDESAPQFTVRDPQ